MREYPSAVASRSRLAWSALVIACLALGPSRATAEAAGPAADPEVEEAVAAGPAAAAPPGEGTATEDGEMTTVFEEILVSATAPSGPIGEREIDRDEITEIPYGDAAEVLRNVSGLALGRMGGHGLEPRLRGLGETHINVVLDGAFVHNACPSRMDPPTSFGAVESFERVVVLKGVQTMRYGGGGSAGTILYQRETPRFAAPERWRLALRASGATHSETAGLSVDAATGRPKVYLRVIGEHSNMGNYEDGAGAEVRSAFAKRDANVFLGWTPDPSTLVELSYENNLTEDALFPGAGMDAPWDENHLYRLQLRRFGAAGRVTAIESELYWGEIDHLMDNYSLRPLRTPMAAKAEPRSDTRGGRVSIDVDGGERLRLALGADFQENVRQAVRSVGPDPESVTRVQSILWPDVTVRDAGLFAEGIYDLEAGQRLRFGARLDRFSADAGEADRRPFGANLSPRQLYEAYYGHSGGEWRHDDFAAMLRYEHRLEAGPTLFAGLSRSVRPADATERFLASNGSQPGARWVGNPGLEASKHHQLDLGVSSHAPGRQVTAIVFVDAASDFILRDRARRQPGILRADGASIYRNVAAELYGFELDVWQRWTPHLSLAGSAAWVHADNTTDNRPIAQIPPLAGRLRAEFERGRWGAATTLHYAFEQTRVDDDPATGSGLDAGETPGYAVVDLLGSYRLASGLRMQVGLDNVFDVLFSNHLNRGDLFDPEQVRVHEPGRTLWVSVRFRSGG